MNKLQQFIDYHKLEAEIIEFKEEVRTAESAAEELGTEASQIVKTVIFMNEHNEHIAVIIQGIKKVSSNKLKKLLSIKRARVASKEEVLERTGYEVGAVPPIGYEAQFIVDDGVKGTVYAGGGTVNSLIKIKAEKIIELNNPILSNVAEEAL